MSGRSVVNRHVHGDLGRALPVPFHLVAFAIHNDQVLGPHHALAGRRGSAQDVIVVQPDTDVAVVRGDPSFLIDELANVDNVLAKLFERFRHPFFPV